MFNSSQNRRYLWHTQTHIGRNTCRDVLNVSKRTKTHWKSINARKNKKRDWVCPTRVWSCIWHVISTRRKQYKRIDLANSPVGGRTDRIIQCMAFMSLCTYVCTSIYTCTHVWGFELRQSVAKNIISQAWKKSFGKNSFPLICNEWRNEKWGGHSLLMAIRFIHLFIALFASVQGAVNGANQEEIIRYLKLTISWELTI